jgi:hypothetical protein
VQQRLADYIAAWPGFDWQRSNCLHFALGWAAPQALAGVQMPSGACRLRQALRAAGARNLRSAVRTALGPEIPPLLAQPGDVLLVNNTLGLCVGRHVAAPDPLGAVVFLPVGWAHAAWRTPA